MKREPHKRSRRENHSENRAQYCIDNVGVIIIALSIRGHVTYINREGCEILGHDKKEIVGEDWFENFLPERVRDESWSVFTELVSGDTAMKKRYESSVLTKSGNERIIEWTLSVLTDVKGRVVETIGSGRDITDLRLTQSALQETENKFRSLFMDSPISLWEEDWSGVKAYIDHLKDTGISDFNSYFDSHPDAIDSCFAAIRIIDVNKSTLNLLGVEKVDNLQNGLAGVISDESVIAYKDSILAFYEGCSAFECETTIVKPSGDRIHVVVKMSVPPGNEKSLNKIFISVIDTTKQKMAEKALGASEEKFRSIFEESVIANNLFDSNGVLVNANNACVDMFGVSSEDDLLGVNLFEDPNFPDDVKKRVLEGESVRFVSTFDFEKVKAHGLYETTKSGIVYLDSVATPFGQDKEGSARGYCLQMQDITQRLRGEEALKQSEHRYRELITEIPEGVGIVSHDETITFANQAFAAILGYEVDELIGMNVLNLVPPYETEKILKGTAERKEGISSSYELEMNHRTGEKRIVRVSAVPKRTEDGTIDGTIGVVTDVTKRKETEQALLQSEKIYRTTLDSMTDAIYVVDKNLCITLANQSLKQYARMFGLDPNLIGKKVLETFPFLPKVISDEFKQVFATGEPLDTVNDIIVDGKRYFYETRKIPILSEGQVFLVITVIRNVTELKEIEEMASRKNRLLSAINRIFQDTLNNTTEAEVAQTALAVAEELTDSKFGFFGELNEQGTFDTIALSNLGWEACSVPETQATRIIRGMEVRGFQFQPLVNGNPIIVNDVASHPDSIGTPKGHPPVKTFLGIPLKRAGKVVGTIGLANKESGYDLKNQEDIETLSIAMMEALIQKRQNMILQKSEERYRNLFQNAQVVLFRTRISDGKVVACNKTGARILGYTNPAEVIDEFVASEHYVDSDVRQQMLNLLTIKGKINNFQAQLTKRDGTLIWVEYSATLYAEEGYIEGVMIDITERIMAEEALQISEERYRSMYNNTPVMQHSVNQDGKLVSISDYWLKSMGYERDEVIGRESTEFLTKESKRTAEELILPEFFKTGSCHNVPYQFVKKNGEVMEVLLSAIAEHDESGQVSRSLAVLIDITERKRAEEELRRSEMRYRNLIEESLQGIAVIQKERYIYANPAFARTVGYTSEELLDLTPEEVWTCYHPDDREEQKRRHKALEVGLKFLPRQRFRYVRRDGSIRWVDSYARTTEQYGSSAMQIVEIDITEQKQVEEALQATAETAMFYLDLMGHDIRNHLQAIAMGADILSHQDFDLSITSILDLIIESVHNSKTLINKIHATRGFLSAPLTELSLKGILDDSINILKETIDDFQIELEYRVEHPLIRADDYLQHLLLNLLENGVLHNIKKIRKVWVVLSEEEDGYTVSIADNGPGIPDEKKETLFDPDRRFGGVGVHQAMRIAQKYGGHITVHDRVKNDSSQGALLRVWLPKSATST